MRAYATMIVALGMPFVAHAEVALFFSPAQGSYEVGKAFELSVRADASGHLVNAAEGEIQFDTRDMRVAEIRVDGTLVSTWSTYPHVSPDGTIRFSGWLNERYTGSDGALFSIVFVPQRITSGRIDFVSGTLLAADVQETNVLAYMRAAGYTVQAERIAPPPAPTIPTTQATSSPVAETQTEPSLPPVSPQVVTEAVAAEVSLAPSSQTAASALAARFGVSPSTELLLVATVCMAFLFGFVSFRAVRG